VLVVWDLATRQPAARLRHDPRVWDVAWSPDGQRIASGGDDHIVRVWQVASAREVMQARHDNPVFGLDWSRDGLRLASGGGDRSTRIWDVASGAELEWLPHRGRSIPLAWSADGTLLVTASGGVVHLWRSSGEELSRIALSGGVRGGLLSADASTLTTVSEVGRALVVDRHTLRPEQLLAQACTRLPRNLSVDEWKEYVGEEAYRKTCPSLP
jgi:WD40 repeat protein